MNTPSSDAVRGEQAWSQLAFLLLFPGFFFYHTALGLGVMGAYLGGYFSPVSLVLAGPLLLIYMAKIRRNPDRLSKVDVAVWMFFVYFATVVAVNAAAGKDALIVTHHVLAILFMVNVFIIFKTLDFTSPRFQRLCLASILAMSAIVFTYSVDGVFYLGALGIAKDSDSLATYQGFSRSYIITFLALIAFVKPAWQRLLLYGIAAPTLFLNTARSEFAALLFVIPIIEFYRSQHKLLLVFAFGMFLTVVNIYWDDVLSLLPDNRILELLDLSQSTSANKRYHLSVQAWQTIRAHPLMGDYASYASGYYAHNILSAWVDIGLLGFLSIFALLGIPVIPMFFHEYFSKRQSPQFLLGFAFFCVTTLLLITSHYFTDMLISATLGAYSTYWYGRKHDKRRPPDLRPSPPRYADFHQAMPQPGSARL